MYNKEKYVVNESGSARIALLDLGTTKSAVDTLAKRGASVTVLPYNTTAKELLAYNAIYLSDGPGNPEDCGEIVEVIKEVFGKDYRINLILSEDITKSANQADIEKENYVRKYRKSYSDF